jgi:prepilin-type N-terminal cleavage/methylation domain-containing protein
MEMIHTLRRSQKGFTMMEILVSVGILAIVSILIVQVMFTATRVNKKTGLVMDIKQNGNFALGVISRMVRSAKVINVSCSPGDVTASYVDITNPDNNITTITCLSDGSAARIASVSGTGAIAYLSAANVTLSTSGSVTCSDSSLAFSCPPVTGNQSELSIAFTLGQVGGSESAYEISSASFQSTITVRN